MKFEQLRKDMVAAMKAKDKVRKDAISSMIAAVKQVAIDEGNRDNITEELVDRVLIKELKTAKEQVDTCPDERAELKKEYMANYEIVKEYAPSMMSAEEIKSFITNKFKDAVASKNKGEIMKLVMPELKGKADGKVINQIVGELCK